MGRIKSVIYRPWKTILAPLKDGRDTARQLKTRIYSAVKEVRSNRNPNAANAPDLSDFDAVLEHWEIEYHQIPDVTKGLKTRSAMFSLLGMYGLYLTVKACFGGGYLMMITGLCLLILGIIAVLTSAWRIRVLKQKRFVFFKAWLKQLAKAKIYDVVPIFHAQNDSEKQTEWKGR